MIKKGLLCSEKSFRYSVQHDRRSGWGDMEAVRNNQICNADSCKLTCLSPRLKEAAIELYCFLHGTVTK